MSTQHHIQVLPKILADQIAAGEVVESPASVIKELVENALDADATEIFIFLEQGGLSSIVVQDNGHGMDKTNLEKCALRHATSKITSYKDILKLNSHGFRGEALAAIAAVSRLKITSGTDLDPSLAHSLEIDPLRKQKLIPVTYQKGTTIHVQHLFSWIPARKKFLRSDSVEGNRCVQTLQTLMLLHPKVKFQMRLDSDPQPRLYPAVAEVKDRFFQLFPLHHEKESFPVKVIGKSVIISGFLSNPMATVGHGRHLLVAINHRVVKFHALQGMLKRLFGSIDGKRGYPWGVLQMKVPSSEVDFNVDPKKETVRLSHERAILQVLHGELSRMIDKGQVVLPAAGRVAWVQPRTYFQSSPASNTGLYPSTVSRSTTQAGTLSLSNEISTPPIHSQPKLNFQNLPSYETDSGFQDEIPWLKLTTMGVVDQLIICATDHQSFYYFDQHALHERLTYEKYKKQIMTSMVDTQALLIPEIREVDETAWHALKHSEADLKTAGFEMSFEQHGQQFSIELKQVPVFFKSYPNITNLLTWAEHTGGSLVLDAKTSQETFLADVACKHSIRKGESLSSSEIKSLFQQADQWLKDKTTCPHGRPFMMKIPFSDIYKTFYRKI
jgi:DNA mismatch repair protein MutL